MAVINRNFPTGKNIVDNLGQENTWQAMEGNLSKEMTVSVYRGNRIMFLELTDGD